MARYKGKRGVSDVTLLSEEAILCRGFMKHKWGPYTAPRMETRSFKGFNVTLVCERGCGVYKHFMLSERGEYHPARYTYPKDYLLDHAPYKGEKDLIRLMGAYQLGYTATAPVVTDINSKKRKQA